MKLKKINIKMCDAFEETCFILSIEWKYTDSSVKEIFLGVAVSEECHADSFQEHEKIPKQLASLEKVQL